MALTQRHVNVYWKALAVLVGLLSGVLGVQHALADANYGVGTYGICDYNSCGISLTSSGTVSLNVTPISAGACTVASDSVAVLTDASTGYTLQLSDTDTSNQMHGTTYGGNISATTGSSGSPAVLVANSWGYRVDGYGSFGAGPTSSQSSGSIPSVTFAAPPLSSGSPDTIATTSSAADPAVTTTVWYGLCANTSLTSDTYTDNVTYTAIVN